MQYCICKPHGLIKLAPPCSVLAPADEVCGMLLSSVGVTFQRSTIAQADRESDNKTSRGEILVQVSGKSKAALIEP